MASSSRLSLTTILLTLLLLWAVGLRLWYASDGLHIHRFFDEVYNVPNVQVALEEGSLKPERYAYLRLTYLPQVFVLGTLQQVIRLVDPEFSWFEGDILRPSGFLICRSIQVVFGALSILLTFLAGRRIFSSEVGLVAALLVAASPTHLVLSTIFKPDILVVATTMLAFLWSLGAVDRPTPSRYLLAGLGIGLAMSSKPTAVAIAIPLTLAAGFLGWRNRRHWIGLVCAGLTSATVFLILNPFPRYLNALRLQRERYRGVARQKGTLDDPIETFRHISATLFQGAHGYWLGWVAMLGLVYLVYRVWRRRHEGGEVLPMVMLLSFALGFPLLYGMVTQNVLPQNLLPVLPFTALAAATLLVDVWSWIQGRLPLLRDRRVASLVALVFVLLVAHRANAHAYGFLVPTTRQRALEVLRAELPANSRQTVRWELEGSTPKVVPGEPGPARQPPEFLFFWESAVLTDVAPESLDRADAEVFPLVRLEGVEKDFYARRMDAFPQPAVHVVEAAPFSAWGPDLVVIVHPWESAGTRSVELTRAASEPSFEIVVTRPEENTALVAVEFTLPRKPRANQAPEIYLGGDQPALLGSWGRQNRIWITDRVSVSGERIPIRINLPKKQRTKHLNVTIHFWRGTMPFVR